jgi:hypothetical protein
MDASAIPQWGAFCFGVIIGWYVYYINRYRTGDVGIGDITSVIGALGGGAVTAQFGGEVLFGAYGIGLAIGFFGYFLVLMILVAKSENFDSDWFLDGRRKDPPTGVSIPAGTRPTLAPMSVNPQGFHGTNPASMIVQPVVLAPTQVQAVPLPQPAQMPRPESAPKAETDRANDP